MMEMGSHVWEMFVWTKQGNITTSAPPVELSRLNSCEQLAVTVQGGHLGLHQYPPLGKISKYLPNTLPQKAQKTSHFPQKNTQITPELPKCEICGLQPRKKSKKMNSGPEELTLYT
jgi:hypothetical protein